MTYGSRRCVPLQYARTVTGNKKKKRKNKTERNYLLFPGIQCPWVCESHFSLPWEAQTALLCCLSRILEGASFCLPRSLSIVFNRIYRSSRAISTNKRCLRLSILHHVLPIHRLHPWHIYYMSRFPHTYLPGISFLYNTIKNPR